MATFYIGIRPVLRGRSSDEFSFAEKTSTLSGKVRSATGVYSNYSLFSPGLLTGAPDSGHDIGDGRHPHGLFLSRRYRGLDTQEPMDGAGGGERLSYHRTKPLEHKGLPGAVVFPSGYGHTDRVTGYERYDNFKFDGIASAETLTDPGHAKRAIGDSGTAATFGAFDPHINKGVSAQALAGTSGGVPDGYDNEYGKNRVNEWHGVTASKAL